MIEDRPLSAGKGLFTGGLALRDQEPLTDVIDGDVSSSSAMQGSASMQFGAQR